MVTGDKRWKTPTTSWLVRKMTRCAKQRTSKNKKQTNKDMTDTFTMKLLEQGHLKYYLITMVFENKRFSNFFANGPITFTNLRAVS